MLRSMKKRRWIISKALTSKSGTRISSDVKEKAQQRAAKKLKKVQKLLLVTSSRPRLLSKGSVFYPAKVVILFSKFSAESTEWDQREQAESRGAIKIEPVSSERRTE